MLVIVYHLFLNDPSSGELYSRIAQGDLTREIRLLNTTGIAGAVFQSGIGEIIHKPYEDERFNSERRTRILRSN